MRVCSRSPADHDLLPGLPAGQLPARGGWPGGSAGLGRGRPAAPGARAAARAGGPR